MSEENEAMANNCIIYTTTTTAEDEEEQIQNGLISTSSPYNNSHCSSMGLVYADMNSLSLSPNYKSSLVSSVSSQESFASKCSEIVVENGRAFWGFPLMGNFVPKSFEEHRNSSGEVMEGKGCESSDGILLGENKGILEDENLISHDQNIGVVNGKETDSGQSKLCARGHWRPAEDAKLKELVALYGPQNWNLIAEKLEGRSGKK